MIWFILSLFTTFGIALILMKVTGMNLFPLEYLAHFGGIIILISIWIGVRYHEWEKMKEIRKYYLVQEEI